jgi:hypothetical protein
LGGPTGVRKDLFACVVRHDFAGPSLTSSLGPNGRLIIACMLSGALALGGIAPTTLVFYCHHFLQGLRIWAELFRAFGAEPIWDIVLIRN